MNIESSTKEYAVTSVRCALTVAALSALLYGITTYHQTLTSGLHAMVLGIDSGAVALDDFLMGIIKPFVTQVIELPVMVKWTVCAVFLWSLCVNHKLKDKRGEGGFPKILKRTRVCCGALIIGYVFAYALNQDQHPWLSVLVTVVALIYMFGIKEVFRRLNEAGWRNESERAQEQGASQ